jgi:ureidoacrylate peracid hydrolase
MSRSAPTTRLQRERVVHPWCDPLAGSERTLPRVGNGKRAVLRVSGVRVSWRVVGRIGASDRNEWIVEDGAVDLTRRRRSTVPVSLPTRGQQITVDLAATALVVVDMQRDFCSADGWLASKGVDVNGAAGVADTLAIVVQALRQQDVPVVWVNWGNRGDVANVPPGVLHTYDRTGAGAGIGSAHPETGYPALLAGSPSADLVDGLSVDERDLWVDKYRMSGFVDTVLDSVLRNLSVTTLLFAGVNADQCVLSTLSDAANLGYDVIMLEDCCATTSPHCCWEATVYNVDLVWGFVATSTDLIGQL